MKASETHQGKSILFGYSDRLGDIAKFSSAAFAVVFFGLLAKDALLYLNKNGISVSL